MRIDEINLLGQFKITGNTGSNSQAIGMSGGSTSFIDVVASGGSSEGLVKRSGYNYIIVEATGDALANGVKLQTAYSDAKLLDVGTKSVDNRVVVLLTPGDYDVGSTYLNLDTSFVDIIGISKNPLDTIIRSSNTSILYTIYYGVSVDASLENLYLKCPGVSSGVGTTLGGDPTSYVRAKNLILGDNSFCVGGTIFGFSDLNGEFENIKIIEEAENWYPFYVTGSINGTFKDITIDTSYVSYGFYTDGGSITGTFSNITIGYTANVFSCTNNISGNFENISLGYNAGGNCFNASGDILGYYKNIKVSGVTNTFFVGGGSLISTFEDIEVSGTIQNSIFSSLTFDCVCKNIKIGDVSVSAFTFDNSSGTFSNIEIGNVTVNAFYSSNNISINAKDIKIGNVGGSAFQSGINITGTYENITIGDVTTDCFISLTDIIGTFKNIKVGNVGNLFFISSNDLNGTYENITVGDVTTSAFVANSILGTYKNISIKSVLNDLFYANSTIDGIFDKIYIGNSANTFYSGSTLTGTFSNIETLNCNRLFDSPGITGYYDGITVGIVTNTIFGGISTGTYKNIKIGSCPSFFTSLSPIQPTLVENIEVGEVTSGNFIDSSGDALGGTYKNIKVGSITGDAFYGNDGVTGTYSNIEIGECLLNVFSVRSGINIGPVNIDKMTVGTCSNVFYVDGGDMDSNTKINKLNANGVFWGNLTTGAKWSGKLTNSTINMIGRNDGIWLNNGTIERSKILTDSVVGGFFSGGESLIGSGQVIYTMTNRPNVVTGATQCISDTSITS